MITYMSISGEASCNGLYSSREGQTLVLRAGGTSVSLSVSQFLFIFSVNKDSLCSLPSWLRHGKVWQSLDLKLKLEISQSQVSDEYPLPTAIVCYCSPHCSQPNTIQSPAPVSLQGINPWVYISIFFLKSWRWRGVKKWIFLLLEILPYKGGFTEEFVRKTNFRSRALTSPCPGGRR